jgi:hypothetical protein
MARMAPDQAWVVCHGQTRLVVRGSVACPLRGRVPARICMSCRLLVTSSGERLRDQWCAPGEFGEFPALGGALDGLPPELQADRLHARLECATGPRQSTVLEEGVDRVIAGQHRRLEGNDAAPSGRHDRRVQERVAKAAAPPRVGDRHGDLLDAVAPQLQRLQAEMPDDPMIDVERDPAAPPALTRSGELPGLEIGDGAAGAEEPRPAAVGGERRVEGGERGPVTSANGPNLRTVRVHGPRVRVGPGAKRVPFDPSAPAARSRSVGPFVTHG